MTKKNMLKLLAEIRLREQDHRATANPKNLTGYSRGHRQLVIATYTKEADFFRRVGNALAAAVNSKPK